MSIEQIINRWRANIESADPNLALYSVYEFKQILAAFANLRAALEWYADKDNWHGESDGDGGNIARVALSRLTTNPTTAG